MRDLGRGGGEEKGAFGDYCATPNRPALPAVLECSSGARLLWRKLLSVFIPSLFPPPLCLPAFESPSMRRIRGLQAPWLPKPECLTNDPGRLVLCKGGKKQGGCESAHIIRLAPFREPGKKEGGGGTPPFCSTLPIRGKPSCTVHPRHVPKTHLA
ncbi:hypothetical protein AOLI_G00322680 [Acnodon oligacanthus]